MMASSFPAHSTPYKLYLRRRNFPPDPITQIQHHHLIFVFCQDSDAPKAKVQSWTFGGRTYAAWDGDAKNPLLLERIDPTTGRRKEIALEGFVDAAQVHNPNSPLRRIMHLSQADLDKHNTGYKEWLWVETAAVVTWAARGNGDMRSREEIEEDLKLEQGDAWQSSFFSKLTVIKIATLRKEGLLWWPQSNYGQH